MGQQFIWWVERSTWLGDIKGTFPPDFLILLLEIMLQETHIQVRIWGLCKIFENLFFSPTWMEDARFSLIHRWAQPLAHCHGLTPCRPSHRQWVAKQTWWFSNIEVLAPYWKKQMRRSALKLPIFWSPPDSEAAVTQKWLEWRPSNIQP